MQGHDKEDWIDKLIFSIIESHYAINEIDKNHVLTIHWLSPDKNHLNVAETDEQQAIDRADWGKWHE